VLAGAAFKNKGVQALLDAVVDYLPAPVDVRRSRDTCRTTTPARAAQGGRRRAVLRARVQDHDRSVRRKLTFFRVYSGVLAAGSYIYNSTKDKKSASAGCWRCTPISARRSRVRAGDIAAAIGLKDTKTGDTLCDEATRSSSSDEVPEPVISVAIEPRPRPTRTSFHRAAELSEETRRSGP